MKRNLIKVAVILLVAMLAITVFVACDEAASAFSVKVYDGETELATLTVADLAADNYGGKVAKADYVLDGLYLDADFQEKFDKDAALTEETKVYAKFSKVTYTITVNTDGGNKIDDVTISYGDTVNLATPVKEGFEFLGYTYTDKDETGELVKKDFNFETYPFRENKRVTAKWKRIADDNAVSWEGDSTTATFVEGSTYFKERATADDEFTYVFLTGRTYDFGDAVISTTDGYSYVSLRSVNGTNDSFAATAATPGNATFSLTVTPVDSAAKTIKARVVESVNVFGVGADYNTMIANAAEDKGLFMEATTAADYVMDIGNSNFIPDLSVKNLGGKAISLSEANVKVTLDGTDVTAALSGNVLNLDKGLIGDAVKTLTFTPKYALAGDRISAVSLKVKVNGGVNVYTNTELMAEYAKESVQCVNILRNIKAELPSGEYYSDYGKRGAITLSTETLTDWDLGIPHNWYGGGVYRRTTNNRADNVVVNGNYFSIDGTKLPFVSDYSSRTSGLGYDLMEVQIGIFMYRCADIDYSGNKRDINVRYGEGTVSINNLKIEGNARKDLSLATEKIEGRDNPLLKMSAAFLGIVVRGGTLNLNNTSIVNTTTGIMLDGGISGCNTPGSEKGWTYSEAETQATKLNADKVLFSGSWANNIYSYNLSAVNLTNTKLGNCNGASLHFDDKAYADPSADTYDGTSGYSKLNSSLKMDIYTAQNLRNWVVGTEAWFVAYGQTQAATDIKEGMEPAVSGNGMTILKNSDAGNMMNFAILVYDAGGNYSSDKDGQVKVDIQLITAVEVNPITALVFPYGSADANGNQYPDELELLGGYLTQYAQTGDAQYFGAALTQGQAFVSYFVKDANMHLYIPAYLIGTVQ